MSTTSQELTDLHDSFETREKSFHLEKKIMITSDEEKKNITQLPMRQYREEKQQCTVHLIVENPFIFILSSSLCVCV